MKVLHTLDSLNRGGTETLVLDVCRNAAKFDIDLTFVATGDGDLENAFEHSGVSYFKLERKLPVDLILIWKLRQLIKENEIDIIHCHQPVEGLHFFLATIGLDVKLVLTHHGGGTKIASGKNKFMARMLAPRVDANIACSRSMFPWLRDEVGLDTGSNFFLVHNGVDLERLITSGDSFRREIGIGENDLLMGMVANFVPTETKDQMTVCRALPGILDEIENAYFVFVGRVTEGSEDYFDDCVKYCAENGIGEKVFFSGKRNDVPEILSALDLFVFSTLNEGLPISLIESMITGVPVIATKIEAILETTDNGKCIETFTPKDFEELSVKAIKLLRNKNLRDKFSDTARKYAKAHFSIESHINGLKTLYSNLLGR